MEGIKLIRPIIIDSLNPNDNFNPFPNVDAKYGPYTDLATARSVLEHYLTKGLTIGIIEEGEIVEYWIGDDTLEFTKKIKNIDTIASENVTYSNQSHTNISNAKEAFDKLFNKVYWTKLALDSFNITPNNSTYEVGDTAIITLTWSWNKEPSRQTINGTVQSSPYTINVNSNDSSSKNFELIGYDIEADIDAEGNQVEYSIKSTKSISFKHKVFITDVDVNAVNNTSFKHTVWCNNGEQDIGDGTTEILKGTIISFCLPNNKNITVTNVNTGEVLNLVQKSINGFNTITYTNGTASTSYKIMQVINASELSTTKIKIKIS